MRDLYTRALYKISSQDLYKRSLYNSSLQDLFTPIWDISIQDLRISLDLLGLFTGALHKISSQDLYERSLYKSSLQDLFTRPLWEISSQELSTRSLHRTPIWDISIQDPLISLNLLGLFTGALYKISSQDLYERSLYKSSLQDLFTRPLWEISIQELSTRSFHKTSMRDLFTRALYKISSQDPRYETSLYKISWYPWIQDDTRSFHKTSVRDLYTRALYKISSQDPHMRHLYTRSPDIPGPPRSLHRSSLQDLFTRPLWELSIQDLLICLDLWDLLTTRSVQFKRPRSESNTQKVPRGSRGRNQNRHRATARAIRHARTPQRVARAETKNAPGWKSEFRPHLDVRITIRNANFSMFCDASTAPATKKWVRGIRSPVIATRNDLNIADPNSTTVSQNEHFELSKTDFKSTKYCACHEKWTFLTTSKKEQPLRRFCTSLKTHVLHISRFPKIDTARRRERTSEMDLAKTPFRAGEMQIFDLDRHFSPRGSTNLPHTDPHTTGLHQMLFYYRKNPIVWPHCLGKNVFRNVWYTLCIFVSPFAKNPAAPPRVKVLLDSFVHPKRKPIDMIWYYMFCN